VALVRKEGGQQGHLRLDQWVFFCFRTNNKSCWYTSSPMQNWPINI